MLARDLKEFLSAFNAHNVEYLAVGRGQDLVDVQNIRTAAKTLEHVDA